MLLLWIIIFSLLGSVAAVAGASLLLIFPDEVRKTLVPCLISYATGTLLGAAFLISIPLGVATALAVIAHEVPQEIGDFGILLDSGYSKQKALLYNTLSSITTLPGAVIAYFYLEKARGFVPYILALSAASFIYRVHRGVISLYGVNLLLMTNAGHTV